VRPIPDLPAQQKQAFIGALMGAGRAAMSRLGPSLMSAGRAAASRIPGTASARAGQFSRAMTQATRPGVMVSTVPTQAMSRVVGGGAQQLATNILPSAAQSAAPQARNTLGHLAWQGIRGATFMGPSAGATRAGRAVALGGTAAMIGAPLLAGQGGAFQQYPQSQQTPFGQGGMTVTGSDLSHPALDAKLAIFVPSLGHLRPRMPSAPSEPAMDLLGLGTLASIPAYHMLASEDFKQRHPHLEHALDLLGLGTLAAIPAKHLLQRRGA
jgi:hypothetical protein